MQELQEKQIQFDKDYGQNMPMCLSANTNDEIQSHIPISINIPNNTNTNLPFVRIHAFDIPIRQNINSEINNNNNNNLLPISITNNREIKPKIEPIKSELNELNNNICGNSNESTQQDRNTTPDAQKQNSKIPSSYCREELQIYKCKQCLFLTISRINLDNHNASKHVNLLENDDNDNNISKSKLSCPGCDNIFHSKISFNSHLKHDHYMIDNEISKLMDYQRTQNEYSSNKKKNIIYLKNVDCLREHPTHSTTTPFHPATIDNLNSIGDDVNVNDFCNDLNFIDLINDDNFSYNDEIMIDKLQLSKSPQKQPLYLQQVQQNLLNNNKPNDNSYDQIGNNIFCENIDCNNAFQNNDNIIDEEIEPKKITNRAAPKIYIKNVDILKEPIYLPPANISNILNVNETLHFNNFPIREIPSTSHISNSSDSTINNNCDIIETFQNRTFDSEEPNFNYNINNNNNNQINLLKKNKSKIYIKNVDILKQPPTKKGANFLHLRTVDELNLMNKNQINLMNNLQPQTMQDNYQPEILYTNIENSKSLENNSKYDHYNILPDTEYISSPNNENILIQNNCNYGFVNLENIVDSSSSEQKNYQFNSQFDLNMPQFGIDDRNSCENEREMLLVCAEELIFSHEKDNLICDESSENICRSIIIGNDVGNIKNSENTITEFNVNLKKQNNIENIVEISDDHSCDDANLINNNRDENCTQIGRIYVSENLMHDKIIGDEIITSPIQITTSNDEKKRPKGRPLGAKTSRTIKLNKLDGNNCNDTIYKCDLADCVLRFEMLATLEYHKKCHKSNSLHNIQCPECFSEEFSNWNTLHTHLWRVHKIDMELYSCELCSFKTPILSRLYNTHMKIHSDERNFKCDQCEKAFKNSKQLKNHRRLHRSWKKPLELHKCEICSAIFSNIKTKKEHFCQQSTQQNFDQNDISSKCKICDKLCSSKSSLRLHILIHQESCKFKCNNCDYITNDHNAFRRHKSTHDKSMMYDCPYCGYKCIQSILYKKHITTKHPELASNIIHKCTFCQFSTINQTQFQVHLAKHDNLTLNNNSGNYLLGEDLESINLEGFDNKIVRVSMEQPQKTKIKVKSDLVLTDPTKFLLQTTNDCLT